MGKRSDFNKIERDYYPTPIEAVFSLIEHLPSEFTWAEPCAGDGRLIDHIEYLVPGSECLIKSDIEPQVPEIAKVSVFNQNFDHVDMIITNPPWTRDVLHPMIEFLSDQKPTWLLFDHEWIQTEQSIPYMNRLKAVVPVGRVKWIEGTKKQGKDSCSWYLFDKNKSDQTIFYPRKVNKEMKNRMEGTGQNNDELRRFRDKILINALRLHRKL